MRVLVEIVETVTSSIRFVIGMFVFVVMGIGFMLTAGASYVAPKAADSFAERAERVGERAIKAAQQERRAREMAKDGWGYEAATASPGKSSGKDDGGWGK
jgi:hypothetical protein